MLVGDDLTWFPQRRARVVSLKDSVMRASMNLLQDPRLMKVASDPRVMKGLTEALRLRGQVQDRIDRRVGRVARSLNLATKDEVLELKRTIYQLQKKLERQGPEER